MSNKSFAHVGIDAGVNTGLAVSIGKKLQTVQSMSIIDALRFVANLNKSHTLKIWIEDARLRKWIPQESNIKQRIGRAKGAGSVGRDAQIWQELCDLDGFDYVLVAPKNNRTKMKAADFKKLTGWDKQTNEHGRDAAMLVLGR